MVERLGEWFPFSSELYCRKLTLYDHMFWDDHEEFFLDNHSSFCLATCALVRAAPFGGSVAVIHATLFPPHVDEDDFLKVYVYTSAGEFQATLCIPGSVGIPIDMGWTKEEVLVVLTDQQVCIFFENFHMGGSSAARDGVSSSRIIRLLDVSPKSSSSLQLDTVLVLFSCMHPEGLFCIDSHGWLRGVTHVEHCGPRVQDPVQLETKLLPPAALDFIPAEWNDDGDTVFYLATLPEQHKGFSVLCVFTVNQGFNEKVRQHIPGEVLAIKVNHTGSRIALLIDKNLLCILSSNLKTVDFSIRLGLRRGCPEKMEWCGSSFIILHFNDATFRKSYPSRSSAPMFSLLIPISSEASVKCERLDWEKEGSGHVVTVSEIDGVRVLTEKACYFLEEVPKSLVSLCRFKPLSPSVQLVTFYADEKNRLSSIRLLLSKLGSAAFAEVLDDVIDAAEHEFSSDRQHFLLAAASFANEVNRQYDSDTFVDVVRRLRVLHAVRNHPRCRMPLSFRQYCTLSGSGQMRSLASSEAQVLVDRLANRCCFQLALDIVSALNMKPLRLLSQWSCHKARDSSLDDNVVHAQICEVFHQYPGSSYVESSLAAFRSGRSTLGIALLAEDFRAHSKVTAFLLIGQWELALQWASFSDDADLIHLTLAKTIASVEDRTKFFGLLLGYPTVMAWMLLAARVLPRWRELIEEMCTGCLDATLALCNAHDGIVRAVVEVVGSDKEKLLIFQGEAPSDSASEVSSHSVLSALSPPLLTDAINSMRKCSRLLPTFDGKLTLSAANSANTKYPLVFTPFSVERVEEECQWLFFHRELEQIQQQLAMQYNDSRFIGCSVARTIYFCILLKNEVQAEELCVKYRVSERKYAYTKLLALCDAGMWAEAEKLGGALGSRFSAKPSIGYLPFVEQFARHLQMDRALRFISKLDDVNERVEWYMRLEQPRLAIESAFHARDALLVKHILKKTSDATAQEYGAMCLQELQ